MDQTEIACSLFCGWRGRGKFRFVEDADQPAAVLLGHGDDHEAFAGRNVGAVGRFRSGDYGIGVDGRHLGGEKANAPHNVRAVGRFEIALEERRKPIFDIRAAVAVNSTHVREVRVIGKGHGRGVRVMVAETFVELGESLLDRRGVGVCWLR